MFYHVDLELPYSPYSDFSEFSGFYRSYFIVKTTSFNERHKISISIQIPKLKYNFDKLFKIIFNLDLGSFLKRITFHFMNVFGVKELNDYFIFKFLFFQYSLIYLQKYLEQFKNKNIDDIPDDFEEDLVLVFSQFDMFSNIEKNLIYFEKEKFEFNNFNDLMFYMRVQNISKMKILKTN